MKTILLYCDEGADPRSVKAIAKSIQQTTTKKSYHIRTVSSETLIGEQWEASTDLLIFPGGRDIPYFTKLQGNPSKRIQAYVEAGGKYLGICAGAYFGCARFEFEKGYPLEVIATRELSFFQGTAIGSAYGTGKFCYNSEKGSHAAHIHWNFSDDPFLSYVYFNGGCYFNDANSQENTKILARYADIEGTPASIVGCFVGKGKALLSGVHPEYSAEAHFLQCIHLKPVIEKLKLFEDERRLLWKAMLTFLELQE